MIQVSCIVFPVQCETTACLYTPVRWAGTAKGSVPHPVHAEQDSHTAAAAGSPDMPLQQ